MTKKIFQINKDIVKEIRKRLDSPELSIGGGSIKLPKNKSFKIPTIKELEEIISQMLSASTRFEEGRVLRFRVSYSIALNEHLGQTFHPFNFKELNAEELRKLAPAVMPPDGAICVYPDKWSKGKLQIQGLTTLTLSPAKFEIIDPAKMIISNELSKIAEINGQEINFLDSEWSSKGSDLMSIGKSHPIQIIRDMLSLLYSQMTREILSRIRLLRHGGTIIFVSNNKTWKKFAEKPLSYESFDNLCYNGIKHLEKNLEHFLQEPSELKIKDLARSAVNMISGAEYKAFIADAARYVAYLTGVDGAVVLNNEFDVLAFGVKIKEIQKSNKSEKVTKIMPYENRIKPKESALIHEFRGKRHLSTARFVMNYPDSIAFTVSQDGGITGFVSEDGKLLAYKGLELLL